MHQRDSAFGQRAKARLTPQVPISPTPLQAQGLERCSAPQRCAAAHCGACPRRIPVADVAPFCLEPLQGTSLGSTTLDK